MSLNIQTNVAMQQKQIAFRSKGISVVAQKKFANETLNEYLKREKDLYKRVDFILRCADVYVNLTNSIKQGFSNVVNKGKLICDSILR